MREKIELKDFKDLYQKRLEERMSQLRYQFINIASLPKGTKFELSLSEDGHSYIELKDNRDKSFTCILNISFEDVCDEYIQNEKVDIFEAFNKVLTHEYLHVVLQHTNKTYFYKYLDRLTNGSYYSSSYIESTAPYSAEFLHITPFKNRSNIWNNKEKAVSKIDHKLLNIAGDFEINNLINLCSGILPENYGLPKNLNAYCYYNILYQFKYGVYSGDDHIYRYFQERLNFEQKMNLHMLLGFDSEFKSFCKGNGLNIEDFKEIEYKQDVDFDNIEYYMGNFRDRLRDNAIRNEITKIKYAKSQGNIHQDLQKIDIAEVGVWKDMRELYNKVKDSEGEINKARVKKVDTWSKFNVRKDESVFIYPGKHQIKGNGFDMINEPKSVVFVDVSGSMENTADILYSILYMLNKNLDMKIVFYDTQVIKVYENIKNSEIEPGFACGTDLLYSIEDYAKNYTKNKIKNIYVLTDGYDWSIREAKEKYNVSVWELSANSINEI